MTNVNTGEVLARVEKTARKLQKHLCGYGTEDGDGNPCDCKTMDPCNKGGITGCCEARQIIEGVKDIRKTIILSQKVQLIQNALKPKIPKVVREAEDPCPDCGGPLRCERYSIMEAAYICDCGYKEHLKTHQMNQLFPIQKMPEVKVHVCEDMLNDASDQSKYSKQKAKVLQDLNDQEDKQIVKILGVGDPKEK